MQQKLSVTRDIIFYAFKYALGRSSYAPTTVIDNIKENISSINNFDLRAYITEIETCNNLGMGIDRDNWYDFVDYLKAELESRE